MDVFVYCAAENDGMFAWLVGWLVGLLVGWLVACLVAFLVIRR
jgi:ABC-type uncharacterized transport system permease subunit